MSRTFSMKNGSVEILKLRRRFFCSATIWKGARARFGPYRQQLNWPRQRPRGSVYITVYMRSAECAILAACATREINNLLDDNTPERCASHRPPQSSLRSGSHAR